MKKNMLAKGAVDVPINMVDMSGAQAGLSLVIRQGKTYAPVLHDLVSEVYHIYEGSGVFEIGGELVNPTRRPASRGDGPGLNSIAEGRHPVPARQGRRPPGAGRHATSIRLERQHGGLHRDANGSEQSDAAAADVHDRAGYFEHGEPPCARLIGQEAYE